MTAEVVNLRGVRKSKARTERAAQADANRARHGLTRAERDAQAFTAQHLARTLDNHRREPAPGDD